MNLLPEELQIEILQRTYSVFELGRMASTCRHFNRLLSDEAFWKRFSRRWGVVYDKVQGTWKQLCINLELGSITWMGTALQSDMSANYTMIMAPLESHLTFARLFRGRFIRFGGLIVWPTLSNYKTTWSGEIQFEYQPNNVILGRPVAFRELEVVNEQGEIIYDSDIIPSNYSGVLVRSTIVGHFYGYSEQVPYECDGTFLLTMSPCCYPSDRVPIPLHFFKVGATWTGTCCDTLNKFGVVTIKIVSQQHTHSFLGTVRWHKYPLNATAVAQIEWDDAKSHVKVTELRMSEQDPAPRDTFPVRFILTPVGTHGLAGEYTTNKKIEQFDFGTFYYRGHVYFEV